MDDIPATVSLLVLKDWSSRTGAFILIVKMNSTKKLGDNYNDNALSGVLVYQGSSRPLGLGIKKRVNNAVRRGYPDRSA